MTGPSRTRPGPQARRASPELRLKVGFVVIAMVLSVFAARLVQLQGVDPGQYAAMAAAEGSVDVVLPATRGSILDRNGVPLAESIDGKMVVADPKLTADKAPELAKFLAKELGVDYFQVLERLRADTRFEYIARQVPARLATDVVDKAERKGFVGLFLRRDPVRRYPQGRTAANLIGFLGTPRKDGSAHALAGLEDAFDKYLSGTDGEERYEVGAGNQIPLGHNTITPAVDGEDLRLTIDSTMQFYTQQVLQQTVEGAHAESGIAVIMDSRTGDVLSLADYPTYDASDPQDWPKSRYKSSALTDVYEPGSTEKVLTLSALIDAGLARPRQQYVVPPVLNRQDRPIHDHWVHGFEHLTLAGILAKSSNIGTVLAADNFPKGELRRYLTSFGLGRTTGVGMLAESRGILPAGAAWTDQVDDRIAFGQSLSVNALQMTAAVNTIANDGVHIDPSLVEGHATLDDGTEVGTDDATERRVVSTEAARQTGLMMERVLDPVDGVAPLAAVPGYRIAGKTGTAQRVVDSCGCYDGSHTASFIGYGPTDDARFTIYVVIHDSKTGGGGAVAGPAFAKLMSYALRRYGVPPTGTKPSQLPVEW
ncbi:peptidoglycan D,D-transpeptidase FtsI family protein [Nocardioides sp. MH1]|uniref:peptidoglycan D,D-transpeptidase FtsI family protein n=1 Tax=Nocardioides sp. MH1 TaxID=3242490 RepID=UPI00351FA8E6